MSGVRRLTSERSSLRVAAAEGGDQLLAVEIHFALLRVIADEDGVGGEAGVTGGVLGMEVRGGEVELGAGSGSCAATRAMVAPLRGPSPVSTTRVARVPVTMAMLGKPLMAQT